MMTDHVNDLAERATELSIENERLFKRIGKLRDAVEEFSRWRKACHGYDDDVGNPRREFRDVDEWELLEEAALHAIEADDAIHDEPDESFLREDDPT